MSKQLILASASPRRRSLLEAAGFRPVILESDLDDAEVERGDAVPERFVTALAWFKARRVLDRRGTMNGIIVAADTVCLDGERMLGKPRDPDDARGMIRSMRDRPHRTITGVAIVEAGGRRQLFVDGAIVIVGTIADETIDEYIASGGWRGKAGGYNYAERVDAGWPIACDGDPTSVMGLPMTRTVPILESLGVTRQ